MIWTQKKLHICCYLVKMNRLRATVYQCDPESQADRGTRTEGIKVKRNPIYKPPHLVGRTQASELVIISGIPTK